MPMISADIGDTNPAAGVMATSPATAPEAAPTVEGLPVCAHDTRAHVTAAMPVAICVATNALLALLAAGGSLIHFVDAAWAMVAGAVLVALGPALFAFGLWRFRRVHRDLNAARG